MVPSGGHICDRTTADEWILAFEAPELHRIVDLMRDLRATDARRHTREETPFFTGPRVGVEELVNKLP